MCRKSRGGFLHLCLLSTLLVLTRRTYAQNVVIAQDSSDLAAALKNAALAAQNGSTTSTIIYLQLQNWSSAAGDYFTLNRQDFAGQDPIYIEPNENIKITTPDATPLTLDFAGMAAIIALRANSTLELDNLIMRGFASRHLTDTAGLLAYTVPALGPWPSIVAEPGAAMTWTNITSFFLDDNCGNWDYDPSSYPAIAPYIDAGATIVNSVQLSLDAGRHTVNLNVLNSTTKAPAGQMTLTYQTSTAICVQDPNAPLVPMQLPVSGPAPAPAPPESSGSRPAKLWWVGLIVGLVVVSLAALAAFLALACWRRRRKGAASQASPFELAGMQGGKMGSLQNEQDAYEAAGGFKLDGTVIPETWRKRWLGPLEDEQVEIGPLLGRGGYGKVYKGRWKSAIVAIKVVEHTQHAGRQSGSTNSPNSPANAEAKIARELLLSTSIAHPNVIATYKICTIRVGTVPDAGILDVSEGQKKVGDSASDQRPASGSGKSPNPQNSANSGTGSERAQGSLLETWLLMEYADRGSLSDALRSGRFPTHDYSAIYRCLLDIASGVDYLHTSGLVHGDLKSPNVLLRSTGTDARGFMCKLADFGLTRVIDVEKHTHISTQTYGTVAYMPPELLSDSRLTRSADIYSFGILMWELCTGETPFERMTVGQVFFAVVHEKLRPPIPDGLPADYVNLMKECWAHEPKDRPVISAVLKRLQKLYKEHRSKSMVSKAYSSPAP